MASGYKIKPERSKDYKHSDRADYVIVSPEQFCVTMHQESEHCKNLLIPSEEIGHKFYWSKDNFDLEIKGSLSCGALAAEL